MILIKVNDEIIVLQFWDACGNEEFAYKTPNLFRNASLAIIVYAINDKQSFEKVSIWINILKEYSQVTIKYLIGNKSDLEENRKVKKEDAERVKDVYDDIKLFFETSASNGDNINNLYENIVISLYEKNKIEKDIKEMNERILLNKEDYSNKAKRKRKIFC